MQFEEKRRSLRIPCENFVSYSVLNEDETEKTNNFGYVHCKNISLIGVLFTTFEDIPVGSRIKFQLQMDISDTEYEDIQMFATVVRCERIRSTDTWDVATSITTMMEVEKRLRFINWLANKDDEDHFL